MKNIAKRIQDFILEIHDHIQNHRDSDNGFSFMVTTLDSVTLRYYVFGTSVLIERSDYSMHTKGQYESRLDIGDTGFSYNKSGSSLCEVPMCSTEEELFQHSTLRNMYDISIEDMVSIKEIQKVLLEMYKEIEEELKNEQTPIAKNIYQGN